MIKTSQELREARLKLSVELQEWWSTHNFMEACSSYEKKADGVIAVVKPDDGSDPCYPPEMLLSAMVHPKADDAKELGAALLYHLASTWQGLLMVGQDRQPEVKAFTAPNLHTWLAENPEADSMILNAKWAAQLISDPEHHFYFSPVVKHDLYHRGYFGKYHRDLSTDPTVEIFSDTALAPGVLFPDDFACLYRREHSMIWERSQDPWLIDLGRQDGQDFAVVRRAFNIYLSGPRAVWGYTRSATTAKLRLSNELREALAAVQHEIWAHWMKYQFSLCTPLGPWSNLPQEIPADKVERWMRQMRTAYEGLSEKERVSDLEMADKVLEVLRRFMED